jgi:hypothetical protein
VDANGFAVFIFVSRSLGFARGLGNPELDAGSLDRTGRFCLGCACALPVKLLVRFVDIFSAIGALLDWLLFLFAGARSIKV